MGHSRSRQHSKLDLISYMSAHALVSLSKLQSVFSMTSLTRLLLLDSVQSVDSIHLLQEEETARKCITSPPKTEPTAVPTIPHGRSHPGDAVESQSSKRLQVANRSNTAKVLPTRSASDSKRCGRGTRTKIECDSHTMLAVAHGGAMKVHSAQSLKRSGDASSQAEVRAVCACCTSL